MDTEQSFMNRRLFSCSAASLAGGLAISGSTTLKLLTDEETTTATTLQLLQSGMLSMERYGYKLTAR